MKRKVSKKSVSSKSSRGFKSSGSSVSKVSGNSKKSSGKKNSKPSNNMKNWVWPVVAASVVVVLLAAVIIINVSSSNVSGNVISGHATSNVQATTWQEVVGTVSGWGALANAFRYIFGQPVAVSGATALSGAIITIAIWLLLFFTFGDIIKDFSSFSDWVSWIVGFLIAVIAANLGFVNGFTIWIAGAFAIFGSAAMWVGLGIAFVAFVAFNIGAGRLGAWARLKRAKKRQEREDVRARRGAHRIGQGARAMADVGQAAREAGQGH